MSRYRHRKRNRKNLQFVCNAYRNSVRFFDRKKRERRKQMNTEKKTEVKKVNKEQQAKRLSIYAERLQKNLKKGE